MHADVLGVILAGGAGRRMGRDKATVPVAGVAMGDRVAAALRAVTVEAIVVGRTEAIADLRAVPDDRPRHRGPLAGLATALQIATGRGVLLVAVDQPLVRAATLAGLVSLAGEEAAVVPIDGGARQVTCAFYPASFAGDAAVEDAAGGSVQTLLDRMPCREVPPTEWRTWGEDGRSWLSVDTPLQVEAAARLLTT